MTQAQIKYSMKRAEEIYKDKVTAIYSNTPTSEHIVQKQEALNKGEYTIDKKEVIKQWLPSGTTIEGEITIDVSNYNPRYTLPSCIRFNNPELLSDSGYYVQQTKQLNELKAKYNTIRDEFMLGDSDKAIKLLDKLRKI